MTGEPLESGQISEKNLPPDGRNTIPAARNWYLFELSDDDRKAIQQESVKILENIPQAGIGRRRIWEPETLPKDIRLINGHYDCLLYTSVMTPAGIPVPTQVPYEYRIVHTKLVNRGLEVVIREELDADQWKRYEIFQDTLGGRPYLFNGGLPPGGSDGSGTPGIDYQIPAEALTDEEFAAIYKEAQKYVGTPYVWGGSTPETGFDCSGYVCWVYNQNGYDVGRTTANGLWNKSQHISEAEAKPGDLVFFEGTYDTPGKSHVGIYLGNGKMVSAGDPIKYADCLLYTSGSYVHLHHAGLQHRQADIVDPCVAADDAAGICHHLLRHIEHRHDDIESVGNHPDRNGSFEDPFHQQRRLKLCHIVVFSNHLNQFITSNEGQNHACDGQHHITG